MLTTVRRLVLVAPPQAGAAPIELARVGVSGMCSVVAGRVTAATMPPASVIGVESGSEETVARTELEPVFAELVRQWRSDARLVPGRRDEGWGALARRCPGPYQDAALVPLTTWGRRADGRVSACAGERLPAVRCDAGVHAGEDADCDCRFRPRAARGIARSGP